MAAGGGEKVGIFLGAVLCLSIFVIVCLGESCSRADDMGDTWTLPPVGVLGKPWNVSLGWKL